MFSGHSIKTVQLAAVILALVAFSTAAGAQDREGRWEFSLGTSYQGSKSMEFEGGTTVETEADWGFLTGFGYHMSDRMMLAFGFGWAGVGYDANVVKDDHSTVGISGTYDTWNTSAGLVFHLTDGPFVPYVGAGLGWTWLDTNVPSGLPSTGCYWDPWYGYICYTTYPTHSTDFLTYFATAGLRWEYTPTSFLRLGYTSQWMDFENADSAPRFDVMTLNIGWMF
jgi:hypothetical protein